MDKTYVLDSFAVLALLGGEPGSDKVARLMTGAVRGDCRLVMSWVNVGEVAYIVERRWGSDRLAQVLTMLQATALQFVAIGRELALAAAHIKAAHPLAYPDALAAALAIQLKAQLVTGDPEIRRLEDTVDLEWLGS